MVSNLTILQKVEAFFGLFHGPGETFFLSTRPAGQPRYWRDEPFDDPSKAAARALSLAAGHDVWFTPAVFKPGATRRLAANDTGSRALWIDLDVDRSTYPTVADATTALMRFGEKLLPPSLVVASGGGLHGYWLTPDPMPVAKWRDLAARLVVATKALGLLVKDTGCTTDAARVLRVPFTFNYKTGAGREVRVTGGGPAYHALAGDKALTIALLGHAVQPPRQTVSIAKPRGSFRRANELWPTWACLQIKETLRTNGAVDGYDLWLAMLNWASGLSEPNRTRYASELSRGHADYSLIATEQKLNSGLRGGPLCATFDRLRPGICDTCRARDKVQSPSQIGGIERVFDPQYGQAIEVEFDKLRTAYGSGSVAGPRKGLEAVALCMLDLSVRDPDLARDCGFKLMAFIANLGRWPEQVTTNAGIAAGLEQQVAERWAKKLHRPKPPGLLRPQASR